MWILKWLKGYKKRVVLLILKLTHLYDIVFYHVVFLQVITCCNANLSYRREADDVCFVNLFLFDRFGGLTHYWGNDRWVSDKRDHMLSAFIFSLRTQRSLWGNNTWDKYLVVKSKPVVFHLELQTKAHWQQQQPPCNAINKWFLVSQRACQSAPPLSSQAFHNTNPCSILCCSLKASARLSKGALPSLSASRCVCNFFTLRRNPVMTCCRSPTDRAVIFVRVGFCCGIKREDCSQESEVFTDRFTSKLLLLLLCDRSGSELIHSALNDWLWREAVSVLSLSRSNLYISNMWRVVYKRQWTTTTWCIYKIFWSLHECASLTLHRHADSWTYFLWWEL